LTCQLLVQPMDWDYQFDQTKAEEDSDWGIVGKQSLVVFAKASVLMLEVRDLDNSLRFKTLCISVCATDFKYIFNCVV